jgi:ubiquinone/menaquinone biosynthesis C-methylase UbiE
MIPLRYRLLSIPLRVFFKLLYHQMAWTYDGVADIVSMGMWQDWVVSVLPFIDGPRVLELGHGPGHLQVALCKGTGEDYQIYGLDRSLQMSQQAYRRLKRSGNLPALTNGEAQRLPFPSQAFQTVVSTFPSEYIYHPDTLSEVQRVLASGGKFVILPLAWITGQRFQERLAAGLFSVTGQAPQFDIHALEMFSKSGFEASAEYLDLPSSRLLIIMARKPHS